MRIKAERKMTSAVDFSNRVVSYRKATKSHHTNRCLDNKFYFDNCKASIAIYRESESFRARNFFSSQITLLSRISSSGLISFSICYVRHLNPENQASFRYILLTSSLMHEL